MQDHHKSLRRAIAARPDMQRAVDASPADTWFHPHAYALLENALVPGRSRDDLLIVMQQVRLKVERNAIWSGVPEVVLAETPEDACDTERLGHFEHDLVYVHLPTYLKRVDRDEIQVCFSRHTRRAYRDMLRQRGRREAHRTELSRRAPEDARTRQELDTATGATHFAQWVPTPGEVYESVDLLRELESMLHPLDYRIAELLMKHRIVQGDKGEIARLLSFSEGRDVTQDRVTRAITSIRTALERIRMQRGVRHW
jgi:DNA-directed RNA polymerase specialized sigma24 family protein